MLHVIRRGLVGPRFVWRNAGMAPAEMHIWGESESSCIFDSALFSVLCCIQRWLLDFLLRTFQRIFFPLNLCKFTNRGHCEIFKLWSAIIWFQPMFKIMYQRKIFKRLHTVNFAFLSQKKSWKLYQMRHCLQVRKWLYMHL